MQPLPVGHRTLPARRQATTLGPRDVYGPLVVSLRDDRPAEWWGRFRGDTRVVLEAVTADDMQVELELLDADRTVLARAARRGRYLVAEVVIERDQRLYLRARRHGGDEAVLGVRLVAHPLELAPAGWHDAPAPSQALA